jgi:membrane-bound lytic murein transglycosylase D
MRLLLSICLLLFVLTSATANGGNTNNNNSEENDSISIQVLNEPFIDIIDSVIFTTVFDNSDLNYDIDSLNIYNYSPNYVPVFSDLVLECRMMEIDQRSPINLDYNEYVKTFIDVYTNRKRNQMTYMLGLAELYYPIFEEMLAKYDLPLELKHLAIVESALNPLAKSRSGAMGLWQFMYHSSRMFDLHIDSYIDERLDPYKSTEAACQYLSYLYRVFNDWQLALAAYNGGPGVVRNAIQKSGKHTFWEIRPYLPQETKNYVPAFIAVNYAMNFATEHNIFPKPPKIFYRETDTVEVSKAIYFEQLASTLNIPIETLRFLNPIFKLNYIPVYDEKTRIVIPADKVADFVAKETQIYNSDKPLQGYAAAPKPGATENRKKITHTVGKGEFLHQIAMNYLCTIEDIKVWNNLTTTFLYAGRELDIYLDPELAKRQENASVVKDSNEDFIIYTVQEGETIGEIAGKFDCKSVYELKYLNNINESNPIKPGDKLKIYSSR